MRGFSRERGKGRSCDGGGWARSEVDEGVFGFADMREIGDLQRYEKVFGVDGALRVDEGRLG